MGIYLCKVSCGVRGELDPPCNVVGYIDRQVLGINHVYQHPAWKRSKACTENSPYEGPFRNGAPFEPQGIVRFLTVVRRLSYWWIRLITQAKDFKQQGTKMRRKMWFQNMKIKLLVLLDVLLLGITD
ncbi:uncharacterized protein LOC112173280 [Rosa chinensis]|uniref:uncharacterized protein LOC112173280 n=1 Tax=Rosa chinensis TaxID=74649 RepID=UPI000D08BEF8|nr:uncharacterized protein LOC112173280 [Rosa chinensis]XP_040363438.1 uncharacterized protein LOC112173280 [Rosa chinensis]